MYISENCNWTPYGTDPKLDKIVDANYWGMRIEAARDGYGLDKLINDPDTLVRQTVAHQGYGLDILINDESWWVRAEVAMQGYGLDILINDEEDDVREVVARHGYRLDILINDKESSVRTAVAKQGYGLDKLANDKAWGVREAVKAYLKEHNLTLEQWIEQNPDKCALPHDANQLKEFMKDFIYRIDESNKLEVQLQYDSIDEFFDSSVEDDIKVNTLVVCTVDTKTPLFKIEKIKVDEKIDYKFIVDITTDKGDDFIVKTIIQTQELLSTLIEQTVNALRNYVQFNRYADDLENCL